MLIPDTLFYYIMNARGITSLNSINMRSVLAKRSWNNKSEQEKQAFSAMRSKVQKETVKNNPHLKEIRAKSFREVTQKYWDTVKEDKKKEHIKKMSQGMKDAWNEDDPEFGPRISNQENIKNIKKMNGNLEIIDNLPRINDYAGVITASQMAELNGSS